MKFRVGDVIIYRPYRTSRSIRGTITCINEGGVHTIAYGNGAIVMCTIEHLKWANARLDDDFERFVRETREEAGIEDL